MRHQKAGLYSLKKSVPEPFNWMKGPERWHLEKKVKHSDAGLKTEGLCGNMEGGYAFICKMQSTETLVSLCVASCLCKHMNKNKSE